MSVVESNLAAYLSPFFESSVVNAVEAKINENRETRIKDLK